VLAHRPAERVRIIPQWTLVAVVLSRPSDHDTVSTTAERVDARSGVRQGLIVSSSRNKPAQCPRLDFRVGRFPGSSGPFIRVSHTEPRFVQQLLDRELANFPELKTNYHQYTSAREEQRIAHRRAEWDLADLVIVASEFTKQSFVSAGLDVSKVRVIPYGAPLPIARARVLARADETGTPLRLVWAGTFGVRKGAHYLVEAWREGNLGDHAVLDVYGTMAIPERLLSPPLKGVTFHGPVSRSELLAAYQRADALIFPTLCDGFGMVVTEAWSQGLPVITTDRAGASDLLLPNENGLIVPAGDSKALREIIEYCVAQPLILRNMRDVALTTAVRWQWTDYRSALVSTLRPHLSPV